MHVVNPRDNLIYLLARDKTGIRSVKFTNSYYPYFYVPENDCIRDIRIKKTETGFVSLFGDKLKKISVAKPAIVRDIREMFSATFEDDIRFNDRFLIDNSQLFDIYRNEKIRFLVVDIEADSLEAFPKAEDAIYPITTISCYDSFEKKYIVLAWRKDFAAGAQAAKKEYVVYYFNSESSMLNSFVEFVRKSDPDLMLGWNFIRYDMQYLINRMSKLNVNYQRMSQLNYVKLDDKFKNIIVNIAGMTVLDAQELYEKLQQLVYNWSLFGLENYSLDSVAQRELGTSKAEHDNTGRMWREDIDKLIYYNYFDVFLTVSIIEKIQMIDLLNELRLTTHCSWDAVTSPGKYMDFLILSHCKSKGIVLPSKRKQERRKYEGAKVLEPVVGRHTNIIELDLKSLYPSIIMNFNLSPEVIVDTKYAGTAISIDGVRFAIDKKGLFVDIVETIYKRRVQMKDELTKLATDKGIRSTEYHVLNIRQTILKLIINIAYGIFAYDKFRLYSVDVAKSVTFLGREIVFNHIKSLVEADGYQIIYGDTDSIFIKANSELNHEQLKSLTFSLQQKINMSFELFIRKFNSEMTNKYLRIELDKIYSSILLIEAKKKYVGIVTFSNNKDMHELQLVGFELKRRDTPRFAKNLLFDVYNEILITGNKNKVFELMRKHSAMISTASVSDIGIVLRLSRDVSEYRTNPQHIRAARYSESYLQKSFSRMDYVRILFIKHVAKGYPKTDVIALNIQDKLPEGFEIDYEKTLKRLVEMKLDSIFNCLNWSFDEYKGQKNLNDFLTVVK